MITFVIECICCSFKGENQKVPTQIFVITKWSFSILLGFESVVDLSAHDTRLVFKVGFNDLNANYSPDSLRLN